MKNLMVTPSTNRKLMRKKNSRRTLRWLLTTPRHIAHRQGFGIHSPFAYDFVRQAVAQPCRYYCYDSLNKAASMSHTKRRYARLLFRVALYLGVRQTASLTDDITATETMALTSAYSGMQFTSIDNAHGEQSLVIVKQYSAEQYPAILAALSAGATIIMIRLRNRKSATYQLTDMLWADTHSGMLFRGGDMAIFVGRKHLPHQRFDIWF